MKLVRKMTKYRGLGGLHGSARGEAGVGGRLQALNELRRLEGHMLLDIGCGDGAYTSRMASDFEHVLAIDVEHDRLEFFRASSPPTNINIVEGSAASVDLRDESVDIATAIEVVEHLGSSFDSVVKEICRVLRPSGVVAITTPNRWWPLEQHGWVIRNYRVSGILFPFLTWIRPLHRRLSDASAFSVRELDRMLAPHGLRRIGLRYMWPPLDGHPKARPVAYRVFAALSAIGLGAFGQTSVLVYAKA